MRLHGTWVRVFSHAFMRKVRPSLCRFSHNSHMVQFVVNKLVYTRVTFHWILQWNNADKGKGRLNKRKLTRSNSESRYRSIWLLSSPHNICYCLCACIQIPILKARLVSVRSLLSCLLMNVYRVITLRDNHRLPLPVYSFMVLAWTIQPMPTTRDRVSTGCGQTVVVR